MLPLPLQADGDSLNQQPFGMWVEEFKAEAMGEGVPQELLVQAFEGMEPDDRVLELDRKQPETTLTFEEYLQKVVPSSRQETARQLYLENRALLDEIGARYGVQPRFIVALWGIESNFGENTGNFNILEALATLAYDGRRSAYFRQELLNAFKIAAQGHITLDEMQGSWAGAMGQCQFMPSSFLRFAVDYDGDGRKDIWNTQVDVFASIANYLSSEGWKDEMGWGSRARIPEGFDTQLADIKQDRPLSEWTRMGVRRAGDLSPSGAPAEAALITVGSNGEGPPYLITNNYRVLLKWNRSRYFATAVGILADSVGGGG